MFEGRIRAVLAVLASPEVSYALTDTIGQSFQAYGGAVRVIWPRASSRDHWRRHRLFFTYPEDDPNETIERIVEYVRDHDRATAAGEPASSVAGARPDRGTAAPALPSGVTPRILDRRRVDEPALPREPSAAVVADDGEIGAPEHVGAAAAKRTPEPASGLTYTLASRLDVSDLELGLGLEGPPEPAAAPTAPAPTASPTARSAPERPRPEGSASPAEPGLDGAWLAQLEATVARAVRDQVQDVITDMLGAPTDVDAADRERSRADALEQELDDLRRRYDASLRQLAARRAERDLSSLKVHADPAEQLHWEICTAWLLATPETARGDGPRPFRFGPDFLASLDAHIIDRSKVVAVCAEVVNRTVHERRTTHPAREGGGGTKPRTRPDATTAWRVYLANRSPGAPRLMFWELKDGGVEFAAAAHHDKYDFA